MARAMDESTCRNCTNKAGNDGPPCMRAFKLSGHQHVPALLLVNYDDAGDPCPMACTWDDLWLFMDDKPFASDAPTRAAVAELAKRYNELLKAGTQINKRDGHIDSFAANAIGFEKKDGRYNRHYMPNKAGGFLAGIDPYYGPEMVFVRAYPRPNNDWQEFYNWYRDYVKADISAASDEDLWCMIIDEAAKQSGPAFANTFAEMKANIGHTVLVFALFAGLQVFSVGRALAFVAGIAGTAQDINEVGQDMVGCVQWFQKAKAERKSEDIRNAGRYLALAFAKLAGMAGMALAGFIAGKLLHWFVKKSTQDWREASGEDADPSRPRPFTFRPFEDLPSFRGRRAAELRAHLDRIGFRRFEQFRYAGELGPDGQPYADHQSEIWVRYREGGDGRLECVRIDPIGHQTPPRGTPTGRVRLDPIVPGSNRMGAGNTPHYHLETIPPSNLDLYLTRYEPQAVAYAENGRTVHHIQAEVQATQEWSQRLFGENIIANTPDNFAIQHIPLSGP